MANWLIPLRVIKGESERCESRYLLSSEEHNCANNNEKLSIISTDTIL